MKLTIAIPERDARRTLTVLPDRAVFYVVLTNTSRAPRTVWSPAAPRGCDALSFELTDGSGKTTSIKRKPTGFLQATPIALTLELGDPLVLEVNLLDSTWPDFPLPPAGTKLECTLKARYEVAPRDGDGADVWTGAIESAARKYVIEQR